MAASIVMLVAGFFGESGAMDGRHRVLSRDLVGHWNGRMGIHPIRAMVRRRQGGFRIWKPRSPVRLQLDEVDCNFRLGNLPNRIHDGQWHARRLRCR